MNFIRSQNTPYFSRAPGHQKAYLRTETELKRAIVLKSTLIGVTRSTAVGRDSGNQMEDFACFKY